MLLRRNTTLIIDEQAISLAKEFNKAMLGESEPVGLLLSGPNGVRKSFITMLIALNNFAQGLPSVYIPRADNWVNETETRQDAHRFFLSEFFMQNADLIDCGQFEYRDFFDEQMNGLSPNPTNYVELTKAVRKGFVFRPAMLIDEAQKLTRAANTNRDAWRRGEHTGRDLSVFDEVRFSVFNFHRYNYH